MSEPPSRSAPRRLLIGGAAVALLLTVLVVAEWGPLLRLDQRIVDAAHRQVLAHDTLLTTARAVSHLGDPLVVWAVSLVLAAALWVRGAQREAVAVVVVRIVAAVGSTALKAAVDRPRPELEPAVAHASGAAFPSGHALGSAALCGTVAVLMWRRGQGRAILAAVAAVVPVLVGVSRVLLGVHWPSDVAAGLCFGWVAAAGLVALLLPGDRSPL
jgi:undecaprenyl-diphosphatase